MKPVTLALLILVPLVMASGFAVVVTTNQSRQLTAQQQQLQRQSDDLAAEWDQLQLDRETWSAQARVDRLARRQLQMVPAREARVVVIHQP